MTTNPTNAQTDTLPVTESLPALRRRIAEALGWTDVVIDEKWGYWDGRPPGSTTWVSVPNWPRSTNAALALVADEMARVIKETGEDCDFLLSRSYREPTWIAVWGVGNQFYLAEGQTLAEAICRAWLVWREG